jgi:hypothetical protein
MLLISLSVFGIGLSLVSLVVRKGLWQAATTLSLAGFGIAVITLALALQPNSDSLKTTLTDSASAVIDNLVVMRSSIESIWSSESGNTE